MSLSTVRRPEFPDTSGQPAEKAVDELCSVLISWIIEQAQELTVIDVIGAASEEIFVPYRFTYSDILRTWLESHSKAVRTHSDEAQILLEKIIESTVLTHEKSGDLIRDNF